MILGGFECYAEQYPDVNISRSIEWEELSSGAPAGVDYGKSYDYYESVLTFTDTFSNISIIQALCLVNENILSYTALTGDHIFGPHIDETTVTSLNVIKVSKIERINFKLYRIKLTVTPASTFGFITPAAKQIHFNRVTTEAAITDYEQGYTRVIAENNSVTHYSTQEKQGTFSPTLNLTKTEAIETLLYILDIARATTITLTTVAGYTYPFSLGFASGSKPCKIYSFDLKRSHAHLWEIKLTFRLAP